MEARHEMLTIHDDEGPGPGLRAWVGNTESRAVAVIGQQALQTRAIAFEEFGFVQEQTQCVRVRRPQAGRFEEVERLR